MIATTASAAIEACARDYIEGWHTGDAARMERSLHPELAKRIVVRGLDGRADLQNMGAMALVQHTRARAGKPEAGKRADVKILDVFGRTASVRVDAEAWVDYLHLAQVEGRWRIVNVLWSCGAEAAVAPRALVAVVFVSAGCCHPLARTG